MNNGDPAKAATAPLRPLIFVSVAMSLVLIESLNFTGFCWSELRYYSDRDFLAIAAQENLRRDERNGEKMYGSLDVFYEKNPNCCVLYKWGHYLAGDLRLIGYYIAVVDVWYRTRDVISTDFFNKFYHSYVSLNACGKVVDSRGISEAAARPSTAGTGD